jgi:zinc-ribbon domain
MSYCQYCGAQIVQPDAKYCPNCGKALASTTTATVPQQGTFFSHPGVVGTQSSPAPVPHQNLDTRSILFPDEKIAWEKDYKEGLIHRHVERAYVITNRRVIELDMVAGRVIVSIPIRDADIVVMDRHTSSTSTGGGTYHEGMSSSVRTSSSRSVGTIIFMTNGVERIKLGGIGDPDGVKNLFNSVKREVLQNER